MRQQSFINELSDRLHGKLPGRAAQYEMATLGRYRKSEAPATAIPAGVLALLYPKNQRWHLVYIERQKYGKGDKHSGQISFPGGKMEAVDSDLTETAFRETEEEIGVDRSAIKLLGSLTDLYIPVSNFHVQVRVGYLDHSPEFIADPKEVREIIEVPLSHLLEMDNRKKTKIRIRKDLVIHDVPYFDLFGKVLWGATAMITNELLTIISDGTIYDPLIV